MIINLVASWYIDRESLSRARDEKQFHFRIWGVGLAAGPPGGPSPRRITAVTYWSHTIADATLLHNGCKTGSRVVQFDFKNPINRKKSVGLKPGKPGNPVWKPVWP